MGEEFPGSGATQTLKSKRLYGWGRALRLKGPLCELFGVNVPVASAVLTAINPERYTIIDFRALESLGVTKYNETIDFYLMYLHHCRVLVDRHTVNLRTRQMS